jgi:hypothetical protein
MDSKNEFILNLVVHIVTIKLWMTNCGENDSDVSIRPWMDRQFSQFIYVFSVCFIQYTRYISSSPRRTESSVLPLFIIDGMLACLIKVWQRSYKERTLCLFNSKKTMQLYKDFSNASPPNPNVTFLFWSFTDRHQLADDVTRPNVGVPRTTTTL